MSDGNGGRGEGEGGEYDTLYPPLPLSVQRFSPRTVVQVRFIYTAPLHWSDEEMGIWKGPLPPPPLPFILPWELSRTLHERFTVLIHAGL